MNCFGLQLSLPVGLRDLQLRMTLPQSWCHQLWSQSKRVNQIQCSQSGPESQVLEPNYPQLWLIYKTQYNIYIRYFKFDSVRLFWMLVLHVSHRLEEAARVSAELFRKLLMTDSTVRPRSTLIFGAERIFSSWLTSWFTWVEFRDATFCVWFRRSLATESGLLVVASEKLTNQMSCCYRYTYCDLKTNLDTFRYLNHTACISLHWIQNIKWHLQTKAFFVIVKVNATCVDIS